MTFFASCRASRTALTFSFVALFPLLALPASSAAPIAPDVLKATLRNGLRVVIVPNALAPVVATDMTYLVGSRDDPADVPGMAHAQEHMMFRGTKNLSTSELGTLATALGGDFNASTSETLTQFQFTVPSANLDAVLRIESDRMRDILDAQEQWENERGAIEQEVLNDETEPGSDVFDNARKIVYAGTPYEHDGVGTKAAFDRLTGPVLKQFYERWYAPNNAVLVVAGNVDPQSTLEQIRSYFESIPSRPVPQHTVARLRPFEHADYRRTNSLAYPLAAVAYRMPGVESPDFLASFVLQAILDSPRGPLHTLADRGEALDAQWVTEPYVPEAQLAFATAALAPGQDPAAMATRLEHIVAEYARRGIPSELFETTRKRLITDQELSRNTIEALASDWATTIADDHEPSIAHEQDLIAGVTLEQVNRVALRYLAASPTIAGALTPSASTAAMAPPVPPSQGPEKPLDTQPPASSLPAWAGDLVSHITVPATTLAPTRTKLDNGLTLIVQPETISDSVFLYGTVRNTPALEEPQGKEGVSSILDGMFAYGTRTLDREAMQREQDELDASIDAGAEFALQTSSATFERAVKLLAQNELDPRFDRETFETAQRRAAQELATALNGSHTVAMQRAAHKLLPEGDPGLRQPTIDELGALTLDDVKAYYASAFRPDLTTIVVVGNVTPEAAKAAVEGAFGDWRAHGDPPALELPPVPLNPPADVTMSLPASGQTFVTLEQVVTAGRSSPAFYPLTVGNAVLGGGSGGPEQSRLFRDLRQNSGLVYSIDSQFTADPTRAVFSISFASLPQNEKLITTSVEAEIVKLQTEPVPDFELSLVKAALVRKTVIAAGSESSIGSSLLEDALSGYPLDEPQLDARAIVATDAASVKDAFATYIHPDHFVRIVEGP
jgi:zinc protease